MNYSEDFYRLVYEVAYLIEINQEKLSTLKPYVAFKPTYVSLKQQGILKCDNRELNIFCRQGLSLLTAIRKNLPARQAIKISSLNEQFAWFSHKQNKALSQSHTGV